MSGNLHISSRLPKKRRLSAINGNPNFAIKAPKFKIGSWNKLLISQLPRTDGSFQFLVDVDGRSIAVANYLPIGLEDVNVYINITATKVRYLNIETFSGKCGNLLIWFCDQARTPVFDRNGHPILRFNRKIWRLVRFSPGAHPWFLTIFNLKS